MIIIKKKIYFSKKGSRIKEGYKKKGRKKKECRIKKNQRGKKKKRMEISERELRTNNNNKHVRGVRKTEYGACDRNDDK